MICERCWSDATLLAELRCVPVVEVYMELLVSRAVTKDLEGCNCERKVPAQEVQALAALLAQKVGGPETC